jgi:ribosomal protein L11 methyltransferase
LIRLAVRVRRERAELVLAELLELAPGGVEEVDRPGGVTEYAIYGPPGEVPELPELRAAAGGALVEVVSEEVPDDWAQRWRAYHRPLVLGDELTVRPPWEPAGRTRLDVVIDPGQAFGTGAHATTSLCLERLLELEPGEGLLDLGCGSGVLAIVAAKLGFSPVLAIDHDPLALAATGQNARVNGVTLEVRRLDLRHETLPPAPVIVANLLRPLLLDLAARLVPARRPRILLAGGLLREEGDEVAAAFLRHGLREVKRCERGEWAVLQLQGSTATTSLP